MSVLGLPVLRPTPATIKSSPNLSKPPTRPVTVPRRSTLKRSIDDSDLTQVPTSPSKKLRVKFDTDVDILEVDDEDPDPLLVNEQVRRAIERHLNHDNEQYERIRSLFAIDPEDERAPTSRRLKAHLHALEANVSKLRKECGSLVLTVISSEWIGRDDAYVSAFIRLMGNLAVTQGGYLTTIIGVLANLLGPQNTKRIPGCKTVREPKIHKRALEALQYLSQLSPLASSILSQKIATKMDFEFQKPEDRMTLIENLMQLIHFVPEVKSEVLTGILQQVIKLDAEVQVALEEHDDLMEQILDHMSTSQVLTYQQNRRTSQSSTDDDSASSAGSDDEADEDLPAEEQELQSLKDKIGQIDKMMDMLFTYYDELITSPNLQTQDSALEQLIAQFNQHILPTHRARHPQFLVFHFAQSTQARVDRFITNCLSRVFDQRYTPNSRHQAAAYFAGFVGRAKNVSPKLVQDCLDLLCMEMEKLRIRYEASCTQPDLRRYNDFYVMFQAVIYIFCLRWKDLSASVLDAEDDDYSDIEDEDTPYTLPHDIQSAIHAAIHSPLNPLRICTPVIVGEFARVSHTLQVFYIYSKMEENKRVRVASTWSSVADLSLSGPSRELAWIGDNGTLEGYFPFDPYELPISKEWLDNDYLEWNEVNDEEADSSEDDTNDFEMINEVDSDVESNLDSDGSEE